MFRSRYSTVLTVLLVILIIAIIVIISILCVNAYKDYQDSKERKKIYGEMIESDVDISSNDAEEENLYANLVFAPLDETNTSENSSTGGSSRPKTKFYKTYPMVGYIRISKTGVYYPILLETSPGALETGVGVMFPSNPTLNQPGNVVIIGHNYRDGKFFSNNKKLVIGDKIEITDLTGKKLTYSIYEISQLPATDTEYITRERDDSSIEISLSTCTDDGKDRLVILAKVE